MGWMTGSLFLCVIWIHGSSKNLDDLGFVIFSNIATTVLLLTAILESIDLMLKLTKLLYFKF